MHNCVELYSIICSADKMTKGKGWTFLLYYPIMKEIDSMQRHLRICPFSQYDMTLIDEFYFGFRLYDTNLPAIDTNEFQDIIMKTDTFITNPLKSYASKPKGFDFTNSLINYHDASPCFCLNGNKFRVKVKPSNNLIGNRERENVFDFILEETKLTGLVKDKYIDIFSSILRDYVRKAASAFPVIWSWLELIVNSNIKTIVTDQTLAPGQCCVNQILKSNGKRIITFQHQKNMLLTDIFSITYLDFLVSDIYYSWFSKEFYEKNYKDYMPLFKTKIIQSGAIKFPKTNQKDILFLLENSKDCLLILNAVDEKSVIGSMNSSYGYTDNLMNTINLLESYHFKVTVRNDHRNNLLLNNVEYDNSRTLHEAILKHDICICDRPGGATIEVMEVKGFVFVCFDKSEFRETLTYIGFRQNGEKLKGLLSCHNGILNCNFDLLCV